MAGADAGVDELGLAVGGEIIHELLDFARDREPPRPGAWFEHPIT